MRSGNRIASRNGLHTGSDAALAIEFLGSSAEIARFAPQWTALAQASARPVSPFQRPEWALACAELMEKGRLPGKPAIAVMRRDGCPALVAPFAVHGGGALKRVEWLGGRLAIFGDVVVDNEAEAGALVIRLVKELRKRYAWSSLEGIRADSVFASALGPLRMEACDGSPAIDISPFASAEAFEASRSRSMRKGWSRKERKLAEAGAIGFTFEPGDRDPALSGRLFALKRKWALANGVLSRSINDPAFEELVARLAASHPGARASVLSVAGKAVAMELGFVEAGRYYSYLCAYDTDFGHLSPGAIQLRRTIGACIGEGVRTVELMPPADDYKMQWAATAVPMLSLRLSKRRSPLAAALAYAQRTDLPRLAAAAMPTRLRPAAALTLAGAALVRARARAAARAFAAGFAGRWAGAAPLRGLLGAAAVAGAAAWALAAE